MPRVSELGPDHLSQDDREIYRRYSTEYGPFENQVKNLCPPPACPAAHHGNAA